MTDEVGALAGAGVGGFDERVYRAVLAAGTATPGDVADATGTAAPAVVRALDRLRAAGLVNRLAGRRRRYTAVHPRTGMAGLLSARTDELDAARAAVDELVTLFEAHGSDAGGGGAVELLTGREALGHWFVRLQQEAREEVLSLDRPPYALADSNPVQPQILARGVAFRTIYAPEALATAEDLAELADLTARGEQARVLPGLALKMSIADRRVALLPLTLDFRQVRAALIRESTLLAGLLDLFDSYWARAVPVPAVGDRPAEPAADPLDDDDRALLTLLVSGLKDEAIARQLGWSVRTMRRRMRRLHDLLGAANRFQAGVAAAHRGWI